MEFKEQQLTRPDQATETNKIIETTTLVDTDIRQEVPREVESWLKEIEKDPSQKIIINPQNKQPVLVPTSSSNSKVILPITRTTFIKGFAKTITDAGLWLSNFVFRQIRIKKGNVLFKHQAE